MNFSNENSSPIGIFDSGYGGLTILNEIRKKLPNYDYIYLGDNARTPYGSRSFDIVYEYTRQCVKQLFDMGCRLIIIACNTASAKALRTIQEKDLPIIDPNSRVLGVIRPTVEQVGLISKTKHVGLLGTVGTIQSESYPLEFKKLFPEINIIGQACPMWVPLIENGEFNTIGADFFVEKYINDLLDKDDLIDTIILGCTHYPILLPKIKKYLPKNIQIISQGSIVADSLGDYLFRHKGIESCCSKNGTVQYFTTEAEEKFVNSATIFLQQAVNAKRIYLE